jgi:hypothetical protein
VWAAGNRSRVNAKLASLRFATYGDENLYDARRDFRQQPREDPLWFLVNSPAYFLGNGNLAVLRFGGYGGNRAGRSYGSRLDVPRPVPLPVGGVTGWPPHLYSPTRFE